MRSLALAMLRMPRPCARVAVLLVCGWLAGCVRPNDEHCANAAGDATCRERSPERPVCSVCVDPGGPDGCAVEPLAEECRAAGPSLAEAATAGSTTSPSPATTSGESSDDGRFEPEDSTTTSGSEGGDPVAPYCGDDRLNAGESCDGLDFGGTTCADFGLGTGILVCDDRCEIVTSGCCQPDGVRCGSDDACCSGHCQGLLTPLLEGTCGDPS